MHTNQAVGKYGERIALRYLQKRGYEILETNWRGDAGELDIIAAKQPALIIVEVKTRRGLEYGHPALAVTPRKLGRMKRLALQWLGQQDTFYPEVRFDVISIVRPLTGAAQVEHLQAVI